MTHLQFTILLGAYLALFLINIAVTGLSKQKDHATKYLTTKSKLFIFAYTIVYMIIALAFILGFAGMFFLWTFSPLLFFSGMVGMFLDPLLIPQSSRSGLTIFLAGLEHFFVGALFVLIFFGPAKHLFY